VGKELKARFNGSGGRIDTGNFLPVSERPVILPGIQHFKRKSSFGLKTEAIILLTFYAYEGIH
jgi:hypothetical protein